MPVRRMSEIKFDAGDWMRKPDLLKRIIWRELLRALVSEFLAAFIFIGAVLASIINAGRVPGLGAAGAIGVGVAIGFAGVAVIFSFRDVSGAMANPAITFGFMVARKMSILRGLLYMTAQFVGAIAATGIMYLVFPANLEGVPSVSALIPLSVPEGVAPVTAILMEGFLTFCLVYVVFATAVDRLTPILPVPVFLPTDKDIREKVKRRETDQLGLSAAGGLNRAIPKIHGRVRAGSVVIDPGTLTLTGESRTRPNPEPVTRNIQVYTNNGATKRDWAPLAIGFTLGFLAFLGRSVTGGGYNPARAFSAALLSNNWNSIYVYFAGSYVGGGIAALFHTFMFAYEGAVLSAIPETSAVKQIIKLEKRSDRAKGALQPISENAEGDQPSSSI